MGLERVRLLETTASDSSSLDRCCRFDRRVGVDGSVSESLRLVLLLARSVALALREVVI